MPIYKPPGKAPPRGELTTSNTPFSGIIISCGTSVIVPKFFLPKDTPAPLKVIGRSSPFMCATILNAWFVISSTVAERFVTFFIRPTIPQEEITPAPVSDFEVTSFIHFKNLRPRRDIA